MPTAAKRPAPLTTASTSLQLIPTSSIQEPRRWAMHPAFLDGWLSPSAGALAISSTKADFPQYYASAATPRFVGLRAAGFFWTFEAPFTRVPFADERRRSSAILAARPVFSQANSERPK